MHLPIFRLLLLASALCLFGTSGCASHSKPKQPASSWRIIDEGDRNPFISEDPQRAGEINKQR